MDTALNQIKLMVKNSIGLDSSTIGDTTIEKIILQRMHQCEIKQFKDYLQHITHSQQEFNDLLETTVIPETWFFRDIRPYEFIHKHIQKQLLSNKSAHFKILSIPSSTGEEPYSLTMYLLDKGITESSFTIDAIDVSQRALQLAQNAIFGKNSFRGKHYHAYQHKHFSRDGDFYQLNQNIRDKTTFHNLNILHKQQSFKYKFDFILCRNLLIYFDSDTKLNAFNNLSELIKDDGYLFIGHSEFGAIPDNLFQNTGFGQAFALIKHSHSDYKEKPFVTGQKNNPDKNIKPTTKKKSTHKNSSFKKLIIDTTDKKQTIDKDQILLQVRELANAQNFTEAKAHCQLYTKSFGEDIDILYLLGLISSSENNDSDAETHLRKGLFLEPKHYDSLIHLSLILEKKGDIKNATLFKKRAHKTLSHKP